MVTTHKLGWAGGAMVDHGDGTASYCHPVTGTAAFRICISDISGFSVATDSRVMTRILKVCGRGSEFATVAVNHGVAEKIEAWFRRHPEFRGEAHVAASRMSTADELAKLEDLRCSGVLTDVEFVAQKAKILR